MGLLVALSGLAIAAYAVMSAVGLWLAGRVSRLVRHGQQDDALLSQLPPHHVELLGSYAHGWRGRVWQMTIIALIACVLALLAGAEAEAAAAWFLAAALVGDALLFFTFAGRDAYIARMGPGERWPMPVSASCCCSPLLSCPGRLVNDG